MIPDISWQVKKQKQKRKVISYFNLGSPYRLQIDLTKRALSSNYNRLKVGNPKKKKKKVEKTTSIIPTHIVGFA